MVRPKLQILQVWSHSTVCKYYVTIFTTVITKALTINGKGIPAPIIQEESESSSTESETDLDEILSDVSNFEIEENIQFPWNLEVVQEPLWFPGIIRGRQDSERLIRKWRAYLNVWVQVCLVESCNLSYCIGPHHSSYWFSL
jgi:hypothetical protein